MTPREETLKLAGSLPMWIFCLLVLGVVFIQTLIFVLISKKYASGANISGTEIRRSVKAGLISTLGPALSIFVVGLGLITQLGAPLTLSRLSVIGNAVYEASSAEMGAVALGTSMNSDNYTALAFTCSVWVMNLGGICMVLPALILVKPLSKMTQIASKKTMVGMTLGLSASLASFGFFAADYSRKDSSNLVAVLGGFFGMLGINVLSKRFRIKWLKEWELALAILAALVAVRLIKGGGVIS